VISAVTGAAGFVGQALVRRLLAEGDRVRAIVPPGERRLEELRALEAPGLEIVEADVRDLERLTSAMSGVRRIFHAAAVVHAWVPRQVYRDVNVGGTRNAALAAGTAGVERFVLVSTSDVFGVPRGDEVLDESMPLRRWGEPYADSKVEAEEWLWRHHRETGLPVSVIYPGWVYGPGDRALFAGLARAVADGAFVFWSRAVVLAWVYVDNLVDACILASRQPQAVGQGYLIDDGAAGPTLEELTARLASIVGARPPSRRIPYGLAYGAASLLQVTWRLLRLRGAPPLTTADVKALGQTFRLSNEKAQRQLGWTPRVPIDAGMERAFADFAAQWAAGDSRTRRGFAQEGR
jgi:nucleoside-diphosphate-sugar epimerase